MYCPLCKAKMEAKVIFTKVEENLVGAVEYECVQFDCPWLVLTKGRTNYKLQPISSSIKYKKKHKEILNVPFYLDVDDDMVEEMIIQTGCTEDKATNLLDNLQLTWEELEEAICYI